MNHSLRTSRQGGFTLMEVVIAMTLLGILMLALSGSIGFVGRTWDRAWSRSQASGSLARVDEVVRRAIENAFPAVVREGTKERFLFAGDAQVVRFVAHEGTGDRAKAYYTIEIGIAADGRSLIYRRQLFRAVAGPPVPTNADEAGEVKLLQGDYAVTFSYFGASHPRTAPVWHNGWNFRDRLPDLIRLQILQGGIEAWPPIVVRPAINAEYACLTGSGFCRLQEAATP